MSSRLPLVGAPPPDIAGPSRENRPRWPGPSVALVATVPEADLDGMAQAFVEAFADAVGGVSVLVARRAVRGVRRSESVSPLLAAGARRVVQLDADVDAMGAALDAELAAAMPEAHVLIGVDVATWTAPDLVVGLTAGRDRLGWTRAAREAQSRLDVLLADARPAFARGFVDVLAARTRPSAR